MQFVTLRTCRHDGTKHKQGTIIVDHHPLHKTWPDRFALVKQPVESPTPPEAPETATTEGEPPAERATGRRGGRRKAKPPAPAPVENTLRMVPKGGNLFDVINDATGTVLNSAPLSENEAMELLEAGCNEQRGNGS